MLYEYDTYLSSIPYIINTPIREYDISKANINILLYLGIIDNNLYTELYNSDRMTRQIRVGLMQKDKHIAAALSNGFKLMRQMFIEQNGIKDNDILSIKKDAVYLINKIPMITKFGNVEFLCKNSYTSYFKLLNLECYFNYNNIIEGELEIKGIGEASLELHKNYIINFIKYIFTMIQNGMFQDAIYDIQEFYNQYINRKLDIGYYREFNNYSMYKTMYIINGCETYVNGVSDKNKIDIRYNINIIIELYKILVSLVIR